jgi:hypothetical protein
MVQIEEPAQAVAPLHVGGRAPRQWRALVHESELARNDPNPQVCHLPMAYDTGLPR